MVLIRIRGSDDAAAAKRIVGIPGHTVELRDNVLMIGGRPLDHEEVDRTLFDWVHVENEMGSEILLERGDGDEHYVTCSPGRSHLASFGPVVLGDDEHFVLGDNRDDSRDSRTYGAVRPVAKTDQLSHPARWVTMCPCVASVLQNGRCSVP